MKSRGHRLVEMHDAVLDELRSRTVDKSEHVRGLLTEVETDPVVLPVIEALDMYGQMGRFYYLDLLGDKPQQRPSPDAWWQKIETAALTDPHIAAAYTTATANVGDNEAWEQFTRALNERIAAAIERLWTMIAVCGRNLALGETGGVFGFDVHPDAVGRQ